MDYDIFEFTNSTNEQFVNSTNVTYYDEVLEEYKIFTLEEVIHLIVSLCTLGALIFLLCVILKFEKLRSKSVFLLHYAIACLLDLALVVARVITLHSPWDNYPWHAECYFEETSDSVNILILLFASSLALIAFLRTRDNPVLVRYPNWQVYLISFYYVFVFIKVGIDVLKCEGVISASARYMLICVYGPLLISLMLVDILFWRASRKNCKGFLIVSNYIMFGYLPLLFFYFSIWDISPGFIVVYFAYLLALAEPLVVVFLLGCTDPDFKLAYKSIFKKSESRNNFQMLEDLTQ